MDLDYSSSTIDLDSSLDGTVSLDLLRKQLADLLMSLYDIGRSLPQTLVFLSEVAQPELRHGSRIPVLGSMFDELPKLFTAPRTTELDKMLIRPPNDAVSLKLLLSLREVALILDSLSYLQLLHLSNYVPNSNSPETKIAYLRNLQMLFKSWDEMALQQLHTEITSARLHEERKRLLSLDPNVPWEMLYLVTDLLKLPLPELINMRTWILRLSSSQIEILMRLLLVDSSSLMELKRRIRVTSEQEFKDQQGTSFRRAHSYFQSIICLRTLRRINIDNRS